MLGLVVGHNRLRCQIHSVVWALNLQPLEGPVGESLPCHPLLVHLFQLSIYHAEGVADNPGRFSDIGVKSYPDEQLREGVERPLKPLRVSGRDQSVVRIEEGVVVNHLPPPPIHTLYTLGHQQDPEVHHCVHGHVENGWGQQAPWVTPPKPLNSSPKPPFSSCTSNYGKPASPLCTPP